ncbi:MAG: twin-arginine translocase subunit TatC [Bacteroidia bacterium]|jgi:sec-independent protein translocase protein TatC|nr:twin-arginine translocase subunit TatC [Paludibacter sp.]NCB69097.1 twin-arginine translocase subunit TatC [Bacteroidia bacterium]
MKFTKNNSEETATFWEHLEVLRWTFLRIFAVLFVLLVLVFGFKDFIFNSIIFKPLSSDFAFYRLLCLLGDLLNSPGFCPEDFKINLININLAGQFLAHITSSFSIALVASVPFLLFEIWRFVAPALYPGEKKNVGFIFFSSSFLFYLGAAVSYFIVFPLTIRFLGTYTVSELVPNQISLQSYMSTLYILVFSMGLMFEMPVLAYFLSRMGIVTREGLKKFRNYAVVGVLVISAFITPTTDPFTMLVVAFPLYVLYEVSILVCRKETPEKDDEEETES